jgi:hypothetical protein
MPGDVAGENSRLSGWNGGCLRPCLWLATYVQRRASRSWLPSLAGGIAAALVAFAIYLGSRGLRYFDAALVGYATATVFLAFGVTYR